MEKSALNSEKNLLLSEQVKQLYRNLPASNLAVLSIGLFLVWILWSVTSPSSLIIWYSYILIVATARTIIAYQFKQIGEEKGTTGFWLKMYMAGVVASGLGWGATLIYLAPLDSVLYLITIVFLVCGLVTGSVASLSSIKYGFLAFSLPSLFPGIIYFAVSDNPYAFYVSFSISLYLIFIGFIASGIHKVVVYSINRQLESAELVIKAEEEKQLLEKKCIRLQKELEASSKDILRLKKNLKNEIVSHVASLNENEHEIKDDKLRFLFENLNGGVWDWNVRTGKVIFSDSWFRMLGYSNKEISNDIKSWESLLHPDERMEVLNRLHLYADGKHTTYTSIHRMKNKAGEWQWISSHGFAIAWGTYGEALDVIGVDINVAGSGEELAHMLYMSTLDNTDLISNVKNFKEQLRRILQTTKEKKQEHIICCFNIDVSKLLVAHDRELEDEFSHEFVRLLLNGHRIRDTVVNFGDYRYGLLMEHCTLDVAWERINKLYEIIMEHKFYWGERYHNIDVSIGITPILSATNDVEQVIEDVQLACEMAKNKKHKRICVFKRDDDGHVHDFIEKEVVGQIQGALKDKQFRVVSTPFKFISKNFNNNGECCVDLKPSLIGQKNYIFPEEDVYKIIKRNNLAVSIDMCFVEMFFEWICKQPKKYNNCKNVYFINLSDESVNDIRLIKFLRERGKENNLLANSVCFVFSSQVSRLNYQDVLNFIKNIKPFGYIFALEKVGIDLLSNESIKKLPIDYIKIEPELISTLQTDSTSLSKIKYINEINHIMGLKTIAENINDESLLDTLKDIGIDYISGKTIEQPKIALI